MSIVCAICRRKQSGWIEDFPVPKTTANQRICANCYNRLENLRRSSLNSGKDEDIAFFNECLSKDIDAETREYLKHELDCLLKRFSDEKAAIEAEKAAIEEEKNRVQREQAIRAAEIARRKQIRAEHKQTTGYDFEGYSIIKYNGVVSSQIVLGTGFLSELSASFADFFGEESEKFAQKLERAKSVALEKLIDKSIRGGGNALIGIDFDYITFRDNMIGVIANGTSVVVAKK